MAKRMLGLDIRADAVAAVILGGGRERGIERFDLLPLPDPSEPQARTEALTAALANLRESLDPGDMDCAVSFPASRVSFRNLRMPFTSPRKIAQILAMEIEPLLPQAIDTMVTEFQSLGLPGPAEGTDILAAAVDHEEMASFLALLASAGIDPGAVRVGGYATAQCLNLVPDTAGDVLFADVGRRRVTVYVLVGGKVCMARSTLLAKPGMEPPAVVGATLAQTLAAFEEGLWADVRMEAVYLSGPGLSLTGPDGALLFGDADLDRMGTRLGLTARRLDLRRQASLNIREKRADKRTGGSASFRIAAPAANETPDAASGDDPAGDPLWDPNAMDGALALAVIGVPGGMSGETGINFRNGAFARKTAWGVWKPVAVRAAAYLVILGLLGAGNAAISLWTLKRRLAVVQHQTAQLFQSTFPDRRMVQPTHQAKTAIDELRQQALGSDAGADIRMIDLLEEISRIIPTGTDVKFSRMVITEDQILVTGDADAFATVDGVQRLLAGIRKFRGVEIVSTKNDPKTNRATFKLQVRLTENTPKEAT